MAKYPAMMVWKKIAAGKAQKILWKNCKKEFTAFDWVEKGFI